MIRALLVGSISVVLLANLLGAVAPKGTDSGLNRTHAIEREMTKYE